MCLLFAFFSNNVTFLLLNYLPSLCFTVSPSVQDKYLDTSRTINYRYRLYLNVFIFLKLCGLAAAGPTPSACCASAFVLNSISGTSVCVRVQIQMFIELFCLVVNNQLNMCWIRVEVQVSLLFGVHEVDLSERKKMPLSQRSFQETLPKFSSAGAATGRQERSYGCPVKYNQSQRQLENLKRMGLGTSWGKICPSSVWINPTLRGHEIITNCCQLWAQRK